MADDFTGTARFRVIDRLGQGGMGVVYRAFDAERGVEVALKTLPRLEAAGIYRLKQEFRALADLAHPNLVAYHELFREEDGERWFFTMELLEARDFLAYVRRAVGDAAFPPTDSFVDAVTVTSFTEVDPSTTADVQLAARGGIVLHALDRERLGAALRQLVGAVLAVHAAGKLHRDIKPSNALVTEEGRLVLLDFGLAREADGAGREDAFAGTPGYMAPEQIAGYEATAASDWYAVGVMLFEALTARLPFLGSVPSVLARKQVEDAPATRTLAPEAPIELCELADALLARDPTARPSGEDLRRRLGLDDDPPADRPRDAAPLVGRSAALAVLSRALDDTRLGRPIAVRVFGPSGVGKSALVARFLAEARRAGALVLVGRCYEQESVPYKALDSLVDELSAHLGAMTPAEVAAVLPRGAHELGRVFPVLRRLPAFAAPPLPSQRPAGDEADVRRRAFRALRGLLIGLSRRAPVVLAIDDIQWGDVDSARLLVDLLTPAALGTTAEPHRGFGILAIGTYRSEAASTSAMLSELDRAHTEGRLGGVRDVELTALGEADACALALSLLGGGDAGARAEALRVARESEGSPFFIGELVRFAATRGPGPGPPVSLEEVVLARVATLGDDARSVLEVTAIAGQPVPQRVVVEATVACRPLGPTAATWPQIVDGAAVFATLRAASLVRSYGLHGADAVEAYHDRIREAVAARVDPGARRAIHAALAYALGDGADPELLAAHHEAAGDRPRAATFTRRAADAAADALAFERAARLYRRVLDLDPQAGAGRRDVLRRLGGALVAAGRGEEAARAFLDAAEGDATEPGRDLRRLAAEQLLVSGHVDEGLVILQDVLADADIDVPKTPARALAAFLYRAAELRLRGLDFRERPAADIARAELARVDACFSAANGLTFSDPVRGSYFQALHLLLALKAGEPTRVALGLANYGAHVAIEGAPTAARAAGIIERAAALAQRLDAPRALGRAAMARGTAAFLVGRFRASIGRFDEATTVLRARCTGVTWELDGTEMWLRLALYFVGDLRELRARAEEHLADAEARGDLFVEASIGASAVAVRHLMADDAASATAAVQRALGRWTASGFHVLHFLALWHEALAALYAGDAAEALRVVTSRWAAAERALLLRIQICAVTLHHLRGSASLAAAVGRDAEGHLRAAERDAATLAKVGLPYATAYAEQLRGGIACGRGDLKAAAARLEAAATHFDGCHMAIHAAAARRRLGALQGGATGRSMVEQADARMRAEGIVNPARWAAMLAPGFNPKHQAPP